MQDAFEKIIEKLEENSFEMGKDSIPVHYVRLNNAIEIVKQEAENYNNGWIPTSERLPEDCDNRFYMCIVENHEEDLPMFCQYDEDYGFGFWHDIYDEHTLGFVDSEFKTNEELGYEKVIAWQPLPEPYHPNNGHYGCNSNGEHERCDYLSCGIYDNCPNKNKIWFEEKQEVPEWKEKMMSKFMRGE